MSERMKSGVLVAIAVFKLIKAAALIAVGSAALSLIHDGDVVSTLTHVVEKFRLDPHNRIVNRGISAISGLDTRRLEELGVGTFVYAAVFMVEGVGLLLRKRWAEYLTIVVTASFIPFEIYEMVHKPTALKAGGIALNAVIVLYLVVRRWRERRAQK